MRSEKPKLYIPVQIRKRKEYIDGFGKEELKKTILMGCIGLIIGILIYLKMRNEIVIIVSITAFAGAAFMLTKKDKTNRSSIDYLKDDLKFNLSNKNFYYKYHNIYEKDVKNVKETSRDK